jgi:hypothetical protein
MNISAAGRLWRDRKSKIISHSDFSMQDFSGSIAGNLLAYFLMAP